MLPYHVKSSPPALSPFFLASSRHFQISGFAFNKNVTVTPLFVAFTPTRAVSSFSSVFTKMTGCGGSAFFSAILGVLGVLCVVFPVSHPQSARPFSAISLIFKRLPSLAPLLPLSYASLCSILDLSILSFQQLADSFCNTPGGGTLTFPQPRSILEFSSPKPPDGLDGNQFTSHKSPVTGHQARVTRHESPVTAIVRQ